MEYSVDHSGTGKRRLQETPSDIDSERHKKARSTNYRPRLSDGDNALPTPPKSSRMSAPQADGSGNMTPRPLPPRAAAESTASSSSKPTSKANAKPRWSSRGTPEDAGDVLPPTIDYSDSDEYTGGVTNRGTEATEGAGRNDIFNEERVGSMFMGLGLTGSVRVSNVGILRVEDPGDWVAVFGMAGNGETAFGVRTVFEEGWEEIHWGVDISWIDFDPRLRQGRTLEETRRHLEERMRVAW